MQSNVIANIGSATMAEQSDSVLVENYNLPSAVDNNYGDTNGGLVSASKTSVHALLPNNNICSDVSKSIECFNDLPNSGSVNNEQKSTYRASEASLALANQSTEPFNRFAAAAANESSYRSSGDFNGLIHTTDSASVNKNAVNKRKNLSSSSVGSGSRGRPRKTLVPMYHSQISGDKNTIKIRIKKSSLSTNVQLTPNKKKSGRRKKHKASDTDASDHEVNNKRSKNAQSDAHHREEVDDYEPPQVQSGWGAEMPRQVLLQIFQYATARDGALPILVKLCRVCKLWREVAMDPFLWKKVDLNCVKERSRTDYRLHWLIENRLSRCEDLNLSEWKVRDIQASLEAISANCTQLKGLSLSGWKGLNADNLRYVTTECEHLQRLDLSSINSTSAINAQPLVSLGQTMNSRLTHLVLAHNKIAGFTQIVASIAANCPNLELLDISNIRTFAHNTALLHVEKLQVGCPNLRVLRLTNSQIWLAPASLTDQVASPGFPALEELSLAGIEDDKTTTARCVDDDGIERILKNSTKLRLLDVRGCIRLTDSGLVKVPAWDLEHLFLSACLITRTQNSGLELILQKWSHSLLEVDLAWSTATASLDAAVLALAERDPSESPLRTLNLCGSSVSLEPVKAILAKCPNLHSINLQSCRALPRGIKRLYTGSAVDELRQSLQDKPRSDQTPTQTESGGSDVEQQHALAASMSATDTPT